MNKNSARSSGRLEVCKALSSLSFATASEFTMTEANIRLFLKCHEYSGEAEIHVPRGILVLQLDFGYFVSDF